MNFLLVALFLAVDTVATPDTTIAPTERIDTLRMVEVTPDSTLQMMESLRKSLERLMPKSPPSLSEILEKWSPGLNDKITHPFAIKERKLERKHKNDKKVLEEYDHIKTFNDLLREAIEREGLVVKEPETKGSKK